MFRVLILLTVCLLWKTSRCQQIDLTICPDGATTSPPDPQWPTKISNRFSFFSEITTDVLSVEIRQLFLGPYRDAIFFHQYDKDIEDYYDFQTNERLIINEEKKCERSEIGSNEYLPFFLSQIVKPSILLGFDGRNNINNAFFTRYVGDAKIREGIDTKKFESCFYIAQGNLTIKANYYLSKSPPNDIIINTTPDFVQIDVQTNYYNYTYNIIHYTSRSSLSIVTPPGVYCPNRTNTKEIPQNLPTHVFLHAEEYTLQNNEIKSRIESFNHFIDEALQFERIDYSTNKITDTFMPSRILTDYSANIEYVYSRELQQCTVSNRTASPLGTVTEVLFSFGATNNSIAFHYTGLTYCGREHVQCHRWIGQRDFDEFYQQYEWYWTAKYNQLDLQEFIPIKYNIDTIFKTVPPRTISEETNIFNYNPWPNSMEIIDPTLGQCYRALGPSHHFNYAILRLTLNNDAKYPVHRHLLSLQNRLHMQLATDLRVRHIRLSSFVIDTTDDLNDQKNKDVYVTFTLLDNPPVPSNLLKEPSSLELIRRLARHINEGRFHVQDTDGAFDLQGRPNSLRTLVLYLLPSENHTHYFNETVFVYHNLTQIIVKNRENITQKHTGPQIAALWTGFTLLGIVVALAIGSFIAIRKWTPIVNNNRNMSDD